MKPNTGNSGYSHRNLQQQKQDLETQIETAKEDKGFEGFDQDMVMSAKNKPLVCNQHGKCNCTRSDGSTFIR